MENNGNTVKTGPEGIRRFIPMIASCAAALVTQFAMLFSGFGGMPTPRMYGSRFELFQRDSKQLIWVVIFALLVPLYKKTLETGSRRVRMTAAVTASILALTYTIGFEINNYLSLSHYTSGIPGFLRFIICLPGFAMLFYALLVWLFDHFEKRELTVPDPEREKSWFTNNRKSFFILWAVIFLCWVPYLVLFFPGLLTYDSTHQFRMGMGMFPLNTQHPFFHSMIMMAFIRLGDAIGSQTLGVGMYSVFQMTVMSAIF